MDADPTTSSALRRVLAWLRRPVHPLASSLIVCRACRCALANPVDWHAVDESRWWIRLRCGECSVSREVVVSNDEAHRLERDLAPGLCAIAAAVARLERERMTREADVFVAGLERDLIHADDFARRRQ
jgi:hypothetical protein